MSVEALLRRFALLCKDTALLLLLLALLASYTVGARVSPEGRWRRVKVLALAFCRCAWLRQSLHPSCSKLCLKFSSGDWILAAGFIQSASSLYSGRVAVDFFCER